MQDQIKTLTAHVEAKLCAIQEATQDFRDGCLVKLVVSNQSQRQNTRRNMCSRHVDAKFTAGPKAAPFSISFSVTDTEGEQEVMIDSELFTIEMCSDDTMKESFSAPSDEKINNFLTLAGLSAVETRVTAGKRTSLDDMTRKKFVYSQVINEALELVGEKHGWDDDCGVGLGLGNEEIYELFELDY
eukprot:scaffold597_cov176-Amphora_coffeaeformis.AAC.4